MKKEPDTMIMEHTEVNDALKGQNVGYRLVHMAVEYARLHNLKVNSHVPFCQSNH
jgi:predicted GNAT family acetyltransferase